jgi:ring-1,2-phenylacetyl-CoA epoxidase subunit PaaD
MVSQEDVQNVLRTINDPEMPINIVDLGIVKEVRLEPVSSEESNSRMRVAVDLLPTFVGCPALPIIDEEIRRKVGALAGVSTVEVEFHYDPLWTAERISEAGREALRQIGVTVPGDSHPTAPLCPFCGSAEVHLESSFGPTRCRMIYYCPACRNSFEHMKKVDGATSLVARSRTREPVRNPGEQS